MSRCVFGVRALVALFPALACPVVASAQNTTSDPGQLVFLLAASEPGGMSDGLHRLIRAELTHSAPQRLVDVPSQSLGDLQREAGCEGLDATCLGRVARFLGCEFAVLLRVGSSPDGRVVASLEMVSSTGQVRGSAERVAAGPRADVALASEVPAFVDEMFGRGSPDESEPGLPPSNEPPPTDAPTPGPSGDATAAEDEPNDSAVTDRVSDDEGQEESRAVDATPRASSPRLVARADNDSSDLPLVAGGSLLGLAALSGIAGLVTGLVAASAEDEWLASMRESRAEVDEALDARDRAQRWATTTNVLLISAGVLATAGAVLLVIGMASEDEEPLPLAIVPTSDGAVAVLQFGGLPW